MTIFTLLLIFLSLFLDYTQAIRVCVVGSGIGGASVSHFLRKYSSEIPLQNDIEIEMFEKKNKVGGRMSMVNISGELFESGATILHPKNLHTLHYTEILGLKHKKDDDHDEDDDSFGIWDGQGFVFKTVDIPFSKTISSYVNKVLIFWRYGTSLFKMQGFVKDLLDRFLRFYESTETRPIFSSVDDMLKWADLYNYTQKTLEEELVSQGFSARLISELVTVIIRINYGQNVDISGMAGAVSLGGSGGGLWSVKLGNWQMASGLIERGNVSLHLNEEVTSISFNNEKYELNTSKPESYSCETVVVATPLDEINISFVPPISIPERHLQHTYTTFVRGLVNPVYFGLQCTCNLPDVIGTVELESIPFSSISILKEYSKVDKVYKIFSRKKMIEDLLDKIFSTKTDVIQIDWAAYPHYQAPEHFAPFLLDGKSLYYINAFENAASTMETSAVSAENIARLILSRPPFGALRKPTANVSKVDPKLEL